MLVNRTLTYHFNLFCNIECLEESIVFTDASDSKVYIVPHSLLHSFMDNEYNDSLIPLNCEISDIFREIYDKSYTIPYL